MTGDAVLEQMAVELREALIANGANPRNPPIGDPPPSTMDRAFREYKERGGEVYSDSAVFTDALVAKVVTLS